MLREPLAMVKQDLLLAPILSPQPVDPANTATALKAASQLFKVVAILSKSQPSEPQGPA